MSRVGRKPIGIPKGVTIAVNDGLVVVKGPKGELKRTVAEGISVKVEGQSASFARPDDSPPMRAKHGLMRALVANMVTGVTEGYTRELEINGVGYKCEVKGNVVNLALGYSHPIDYPLPAGVSCKLDKNKIILTGIDKESVGLAAAKIRSFKVPDPYQQKGVKYVGEIIRKKVGKTGAS
ncbi:MAG TPA: 50S ribosomal protein L6 [Polyangia bacterium]|jgi:large subunit ribosomal protein L6